MQRSVWLLPTVYFFVCELLALTWEGWLAHQVPGTVGVIASLLFALFTLPGQIVAPFIQMAVAKQLGYVPGDSLIFNSFWPRIIGAQSAIIFCTLVLFFLTFSSQRKRDRGQS